MKISLREISRSVAALIIASAAALIPQKAIADYPERAITLVVPFGAGGVNDIVVRALLPELSKALGGVDIAVQNTPGANGTIGVASVAKSNTDGYTIGLVSPGPITAQPHLRELPYGVESFSYICQLYASPPVLMVKKGSKFSSFKEVIDEARDNPRRLTYASSGPGGFVHLIFLGVERESGIQLRHLPTRGAPYAMQMMMADTIQLYADSPNLLGRYEVEALAVFADERLAELPDTPTARELGFPLTFLNWAALVAPQGTPPQIVERLDAACNNAVNSKEFAEAMAKQDLAPSYKNGQQFYEYVKSSHDYTGALLENIEVK